MEHEGEELLELAATAHHRFKTAPPEDRRQLLSYLCSNCNYDGEKLTVNLKKPFDLMLIAAIAERTGDAERDPKTGRAEEWWRLGGSNP